MKNKILTSSDYKKWLIELKQKFQKAQIKAAVKVNSIRLVFYCNDKYNSITSCYNNVEQPVPHLENTVLSKLFQIRNNVKSALPTVEEIEAEIGGFGYE